MHLLKSLKEAHAMAAKQKKAFADLSATFNAAIIQRWEEVVRAWEDDPAKSKVDPFDEQDESKCGGGEPWICG